MIGVEECIIGRVVKRRGFYRWSGGVLAGCEGVRELRSSGYGEGDGWCLGKM